MSNSNIEIRIYKKEDYQDTISILKEGYESKITQVVLEKEYIGEDKNILVAEDTDELKVVGCIFWKVEEDYVRPGRKLYLEYLVVANEYRRKGIAHLLYKELEKICKKKKCTSIEFTSANFRTGAHALYKSMDYTIKDTSIFIKEIR